MSNLQATLIALGIVAAAVVFSQNSTAQTDAGPRFQIQSASDASVWRLDTESGNIELCVVSARLAGAETELDEPRRARCP